MAASAAAVVVVVLAPPIANGAHDYDWAEALQYVVLALVGPGLLVAAAPWRGLGLGRPARALAEARRRHPERLRTAALVGAALACMGAWRAPVAVDRLRSGGWPLPLEVVTLGVSGTVLWLECVGSAPLEPRSTRPLRIALGAVSMWALWALAYLVAMSNANWYPAYKHLAGSALSVLVDQQLAAGVIWVVSGACFIPLIFWNLAKWLQSEEDPDQELHRLVREHRRRSSPTRPSL